MKFCYMILLIGVVVLLGCNKPVGETAVLNPPITVTPVRTVYIATATEVKAALLGAKSGDDIVLVAGAGSGISNIPLSN